MRNREFVMTGSLILYTVVLVLALIVTIITFVASSVSSGLLGWAVRNHLVIMIVMVFLAIGYGFFWSWYLGRQLKAEESNTQSILDVVLLFLSAEEKRVLLHLLENSGRSTQAEIARLEKFGGVKALRMVTRMSEKNLVTVSNRGKMRDVVLRDEIYTVLSGEVEKIRASCEC